MPSLPMDIVFILDKSGSMSGRKMKQLRGAMTTILSDMRSDDRFNIITFDGSVRTWVPESVPATTKAIADAKDFVQKIPASGCELN